MKRKIVSLHGSYYGNNYGDILLVSLFANWIKNACPNCIINLPLANKNKTKDLPEGTTGIINLLRSKGLVFCGGGYFGEQPKNKGKWARRNFSRHGIVGVLAILFHIPYVIIGVEFGPISKKWFRKVCIMIAKHAKIVVVRNAESKHYLEQYGLKNVHQSVDAVLSLAELVRPNQNINNKEILVHIPGIYNCKAQYIKLCEQLTKAILSENKSYTIGLIHDDFEDIYNTESYKPIMDIFENSKVPYKVYKYSGYKELIDIINNHTFVITTKLHVGITAAALNIRPLSFWLHPKSKRLHYQIENSHFCNSIDDTTSYYETIIEYLNQKKPYTLPISIKDKALINKNRLSDFIRSII